MHSIFRYVYFFPEFGLKVPSKVADVNHNSDQNLMVPLWKKKKKKRVLISEYSFYLILVIGRYYFRDWPFQFIPSFNRQ